MGFHNRLRPGGTLALALVAGAASAQDPNNPRDVQAIPPAEQRTVSSDNLTLPDFIQGPSEEAIYNAWPIGVRRLAYEGSATMRCVVNTQGRLQDCRVERESRERMGFGLAALSLAPLYKALPALDTRDQPMSFSVPISINFVCGARCTPLPEDLDHALVLKPVWDAAPTMAELRAVYPAAMVAAERGAEVLLQCRVGRQGVLTGCKVAAETPANEGFGRAALSLSPKFKLRLPARPGDFINAEVRVPVSFAVRDGRVLTGAAEMVEGPSREEVRDATPPDTSTGQATLSCSVMAGGALNACEVTGETPAGRGLGQAAMKLSPRFRVGLWTPDGRPTVGSTALIPFSFDAPPPRLEGPIPRVEFPSWAKMPTAAEMSFIYPQRALRNHRDGDVEMLCTVREDGQVESCRVIKEEPKGQGFGAAALSLTKLFRLNPTMVDGRPVMPAGFQVNIPIKFRTW